MALWALAFRATLDCLRVDRFVVARQRRDNSVTRALAAAGLLRTGHPPSRRYSCIFSLPYGEEVYKCTVRYLRAGDNDTWDLESTESTEAELMNLPDAPEEFVDS